MLDGRTKVAIVGFCTTSRDLAPYDDPTFEIWGLNRGYLFMPRADRWFDMHGLNILNMQQRRPGNHVQWLKDFKGPVYVHQRFEELGDNQVVYPLQQMADFFGERIFRVGAPMRERCESMPCASTDHREPASGGVPPDGCTCACHAVVAEHDTKREPYLSSSIAYELALAIAEGFEEIHLYGVDLTTEAEYAWQKPGVEFLLGYADGYGTKVVLPGNCPLLKGALYGRGFLSERPEHMSYEQMASRLKTLQHDAEMFQIQIARIQGSRTELVEYVLPQMVPGVDHEKVEERIKEMERHLNDYQGKLHQLSGAIQETAYWLHQTYAGQEPDEAMAQLVRLNQKELAAEGPITELEALQHRGVVVNPATPGALAETHNSAYMNGHNPLEAIPVGAE